ncbi:MAG TPA: dihydroorotase [Thermomicrobiales bacterium]|nr:dihydroorotase [Thermomicrobiales bacterium]
MSRLRLRNGRIVDPATSLDQIADVLVIDGRIAEIGTELGATPVDREVDCTGFVISPGWTDMHVHLRVPGQEYKETIETGTAAAAAGGFTAIAVMPNTDPALDSLETIGRLLDQCRERAAVRVMPIGAITIGRAGKELVDFEALANFGVVGFSDDGISTANSTLMAEALVASTRVGRPVMVHCEDPYLVGGVMHGGEVSARLGLAGIKAAAEESFIARDCLLAHETGGWLHVLHVSTAIGLQIIKYARTLGAHVTAEIMPHHLVMTDEWVAGDRTLQNTNERGPHAPFAHPDTKVNPPLRTADDTRTLLAGLANGDFDILATDHAPHAAHEKRDVPITNAAFGMIGLELAVPTMLALVRAGHLTIEQVIDRFSTQPARIWNLPGGSIETGDVANLTIIDPDHRWTVTEDALKSKSKNTPLLGMEMTGRAVMTIVEGKVVHDLCR